MTLSSMLAVSLPANPAFADNLQYQITGMLVVLTTLGGMALIVWIAGKLFAARDSGKQAEIASAAEATDISGPLHAVIAAAVATALGDRQFVVQGIRMVDPLSSLAWGAEGRRTIYATRKVR